MLVNALQFGVEIEVVVVPQTENWNDAQFREKYQRYWYDRFAKFLKEQGLLAAADPIRNNRTTKYPENWDYSKWYITTDISVKGTPSPRDGHLYALPMEAVSPIMKSNGGWRAEIQTFWGQLNRIFDIQKDNLTCGSHVHVAPIGRRFSFRELQQIAMLVLTFEDHISNLLPSFRRKHRFCRDNSDVSPELQAMKSGGMSMSVRNNILNAIKQTKDAEQLYLLIQGNAANSRQVLWNFRNTLGKSGTVEFRGGRHLQGQFRTRAWISLTISIINIALHDGATLSNARYERPGTAAFEKQFNDLWIRIRRSAELLGCSDCLPRTPSQMNETQIWD